MEQRPISAVRTGVRTPHTIVYIETDMLGEKSYISQRNVGPTMAASPAKRTKDLQTDKHPKRD